jgi:hypothetical protein
MLWLVIPIALCAFGVVMVFLPAATPEEEPLPDRASDCVPRAADHTLTA